MSDKVEKKVEDKVDDLITIPKADYEAKIKRTYGNAAEKVEKEFYEKLGIQSKDDLDKVKELMELAKQKADAEKTAEQKLAEINAELDAARAEVGKYKSHFEQQVTELESKLTDEQKEIVNAAGDISLQAKITMIQKLMKVSGGVKDDAVNPGKDKEESVTVPANIAEYAVENGYKPEQWLRIVKKNKTLCKQFNIKYKED